MNVVIDVGNTRIKYAFFEEEQLIRMSYDADNIIEELKKAKKEFLILNVLVSGSNNLNTSLYDAIKILADFFIDSTQFDEFPIPIAYTNLKELGRDRIADCIGACSLYKGVPLLVIDAGTCFTYNYINESGCFLGGNISPGAEIRFRSLNDYTARLPLVKVSDDVNYCEIAKNTSDAILNGVMCGMIFEVNGYINDFMSKHRFGKVLVTGGNSKYLVDRLNSNVIYEEMLGILGLNIILLLKIAGKDTCLL